MSFLRKDGLQSFGNALRSLPRFVWIMVIVAFILGLALRGGGGGGSEPSQVQADQAQSEIEVEWWTCSMHPQFKLEEPGQCPICFMDLIPMESHGSGDIPTELKMSESAMKLAAIVTEPVHRGTAYGEIQLSGKVATDETRLGKITAWVPGRLEKLYVDYTGVTVKKGDPLVELYSPALYAAQEELIQAKKFVDSSESDLVRSSAKLTLDAAREKLRQLGLTDDQTKQIEERESATERITIHSPMTGVVIHKNAVEGLYVNKGAPIYTIAELSNVWVLLDAYETDVPALQVGQSVDFSVEAIPGKTYEGEVIFVDPILDEKTRTVRVRLDAENPEQQLKPGMYVRATVHTEISEGLDGDQPLLIPISSVLKTGNRAVVYIKKPDTDEPTFEGREIQIGQRAGDYYIVTAGLDEGEEIVIRGNFKIDSAFQIAAKPSMMNPVEGTSGDSDEATEVMIPISFLEALIPVYITYFKAQTALAADDFETGKNELVELREIIKNMSDHDSLRQWRLIRKDLLDALRNADQWPDMEAIRIAFEPISYSILKMERILGHTGDETHYEVYCPMAFNDKGAPWLQNHDVVDNPYFGSMMLRCGEVRETFLAKK